jgi:hypothetical protein
LVEIVIVGIVDEIAAWNRILWLELVADGAVVDYDSRLQVPPQKRQVLNSP